MKLTGAQALVRVLAAEQVKFVFGVVGGKLAPLLHAIHQDSRLRFVGVRHEASGAIMATADFAGSGRVAVAIGEMGPGGLNLASGAGIAFNNNLAMLLITTNQHRAASYPHSGMFMDLDVLAVLKPLTKWNAAIHDPRRIPELARRAFREALSGRPGPVHLDIPQDVLAASCDFADDEFDLLPARYRAIDKPRPAERAVSAAADLLRRASRPLIVAGGGVITSGAEAGIRKLAALLRAPVVPTQMALGAVATDSPFFIGHGGLIGGAAIQKAFAEADVILAAGCRFSSWMWDDQGPLARRHHHLININIDPSALGAPAIHDVPIHADVAATIDDLLSGLTAEPPMGVAADWLRDLRQARAEYEKKLETMVADRSSPVMHPAALGRAIAQALPKDAIAVYDGGHTTFWSNDLTPVSDARTRFHDPGMSQLGFGLPYALSLQLQHPGKPIVNITGDGAFGFTLQELDTARRLKLPVVTVIHNNASWGIIRAGQRMQYDFELATGLEDTDYAAIAKGFGCVGETVSSPDEIAPALQRAIASGLPSVIDCKTRFVPHPAMPAFGAMNRYGFDALTRTPPVHPPVSGERTKT